MCIVYCNDNSIKTMEYNMYVGTYYTHDIKYDEWIKVQIKRIRS